MLKPTPYIAGVPVHLYKKSVLPGVLEYIIYLDMRQEIFQGRL